MTDHGSTLTVPPTGDRVPPGSLGAGPSSGGAAGPRGRPAWIVLGSILAVATLGWGTFEVVDLLAHERRTERSSVTAPVSEIDIVNDAGPIRIVATDADRVTVVAAVSEGLRSTGFSQQLVGDRLVLRASCPTVGGTWCSVSYTIEIPTKTAVRVRSDGRIRVEGVAGDVDARSDNGSVVVTGSASASVSARSEHGRVEVRFTSPPDTVTARSEHGDVEVVVPETAGAYRVDASSRHGDVETSIRTDPAAASSITAASEHGNVTVRFGS